MWCACIVTAGSLPRCAELESLRLFLDLFAIENRAPAILPFTWCQSRSLSQVAIHMQAHKHAPRSVQHLAAPFELGLLFWSRTRRGSFGHGWRLAVPDLARLAAKGWGARAGTDRNPHPPSDQNCATNRADHGELTTGTNPACVLKSVSPFPSCP